MPTAKLKASGSAPEVEIVVGHLHRADYEFWLFDASGANPVLLHSGKTGDLVPDKATLPAVASLNGRTLFWQAGLVSFVDQGASEPFSVVVRMTQDGQIVSNDGGTGTMSRPIVDGQIRMTVAP